MYLVWQLRQYGFEVRFTWPNVLYISWRHHEGAYLANQNPIVQAMTPPPPVPKSFGAPQGGSQKKKGGLPPIQQPLQSQEPSWQAQQPSWQRPAVAFNEAVDIINTGRPAAPSPQPAPFGNGGARRATDYEPPASFIQSIERPGPGRDKAIAKGNVLADLWTI